MGIPIVSAAAGSDPAASLMYVADMTAMLFESYLSRICESKVKVIAHGHFSVGSLSVPTVTLVMPLVPG